MDPVIGLWREAGKQINQVIETHDRMEIKIDALHISKEVT